MASTLPNLTGSGHHPYGYPVPTLLTRLAEVGSACVTADLARPASRRRLRDVAGRIREDDIAEVREKARIDDVVWQYVALRNAGGGSMKGLCPFHDEKSPSFHVTPSRGFWHCFGCQEGGDVITFVMKHDGLSFVRGRGEPRRTSTASGFVARRTLAVARRSGPAAPPGPG